ncbi:SLBB domain-containing protein [Neolewinella lacunae]|uniref:SLBB domain-containing protein n=1 Tax=Neolewinella lacunae TaxID=1517758 RepID=A0A923T8N9_9BACT|nr:SLBB domain-containing protein [Neolewinella lacunae]MBC6994168.1 SLBB domain-containing protein [Neolewinella lacunae]MDN3636683.1 SLBB domain-containing protein [Neolewinella lacunae]
MLPRKTIPSPVQPLYRALLALLFVLALAPAAAQNTPVPTQAQARQELRERDIDEAELRRRLLAEGIDVDRMAPDELLRAQPRIEAIIAQMEAEKRAATPPPTTRPGTPPAMPQDTLPEPPPPPEPSTEGLEESMIYGHELFRNKSLQVYRATENATPPDSYPLRVGDEIAVTIFGASQTDFILRIDDRGFVQLQNGLRLPLAGIPIGQAREVLGNRLKQYYAFRDGQLSIRIQVARTVNVNIFGEVENNGNFTMSGLNTGFNALAAAGGPTERGSVRNILLTKGDQTVTLDVYKFLQDPRQRSDLFLTDNATIFVPLASTVVDLTGGVQRPMRYEMRAGETIKDLLDFAGGPLPRAELSNISVTRYQNGALRVFDVDLATNPGFGLQNGDSITVGLVENPIEDFVSIEGAVLLPGRYAFQEGMTLDRLIALGRPRPGARRDVAFLFRQNDNGTNRLIRVALDSSTVNNGALNAGAGNVELQRGDQLRILAQASYVDQSTFQVSGAVRDSAVTLPFPQDGGVTLDEAILLAGGLLPNALPEVMLIRTPISNRDERVYQRLDLRVSGDFVLEPLDEVRVYNSERYQDQPVVRISGAVRSGGVYPYSASLQLNDLIYLSGGLRTGAASDRIDVFRLQILDGAETKTLLTTLDLAAAGDFALQPFDEVIVRNAAEFELIRNVVVFGEVRYPGQYALLKDNERLSDIIQRAGGLTQEASPEAATLYRGEQGIGYVILNLERAVADPADPTNMVLLNQDTLYIPKRNELVTIYTARTLATRFGTDSTNVDGTIQVAFQGEKSAKWYIDRYAGGFNDDTARKRWTTVEYANGRVQETNNFLGIKAYPQVRPGASIRVAAAPPKQQKQRREERFDWIGLAQVVLGAATTLTTFILLRR